MNIVYQHVIELQVQRSYEFLPREAVQYFCNTCAVCQLKQPQNSIASLKPIIASGFLTHGQIRPGKLKGCLIYHINVNTLD